jgi:hypothetical protein
MGALAVPLQVTINIGELPMGLGTATMLARYLLIMEVSEMYMRAFAPYTFGPWFRFGEGNKAEGLSRFLAAVAAPTGLRALDEELRCRLKPVSEWHPVDSTMGPDRREAGAVGVARKGAACGLTRSGSADSADPYHELPRQLGRQASPSRRAQSLRVPGIRAE